MREQEVRNLWEAYLEVCEQETGRGPRISDTYDMRDAEGGPKGGGTIKIKGPKKKNVIRKEEVEAWVNQLVKEGYDLSEYSWDDMSEIYISEVKGIEGHINPNTGQSSYGLDSGLAMTPRKRMETRANALQKRGEGKRANKIRAVMNRPSMEESFDLYDTILEHLVAEGYADTNESALVIMANMSEEWRHSIIDEGKVELKQRNKNEMQRKAGNLGREVVSTPNTKKNAVKRGAAMNRMGKLVSAIASDDEDKRFDRMPTSR